jgi:hypothetical protein
MSKINTEDNKNILDLSYTVEGSIKIIKLKPEGVVKLKARTVRDTILITNTKHLITEISDNVKIIPSLCDEYQLLNHFRGYYIKNVLFFNVQANTQDIIREALGRYYSKDLKYAELSQ